MKYDEKEFLELLQEFKSDETKKARRNLSTISFVILCAWILGVRFTELKVLGLDISKSPEPIVLLIALSLVVYWAFMFLLSWNHDREIQAERSIHLNTQIEYITKRLQSYEEKLRTNPGMILADYKELKAAVEAHKAQQTRTKRAARYGNVMGKLELVVPLAIASLATLVLVVGVFRAFMGGA